MIQELSANLYYFVHMTYNILTENDGLYNGRQLNRLLLASMTTFMMHVYLSVQGKDLPKLIEE